MGKFEDDLLVKLNIELSEMSREEKVFFCWLAAFRALPCYTCEILPNESVSQDIYKVFWALDMSRWYLSKAGVSRQNNIAQAAADLVELQMNEKMEAPDYVADAVRLSLAVNMARGKNDEFNEIVKEIFPDHAIKAFEIALTQQSYRKGLALLLDDIQRIKAGNCNRFKRDTDFYGPEWPHFLNTLVASGCGYWAKLYQTIFDQGFKLDMRALERRIAVPAEIQDKGAAAVGVYLTDLEKQGGERLNEARIIILGEKGAGKTCLARRLIDPKAQMTEDGESTEGVETTLWRIESPQGAGPVNIHIWDFAGHVVTHAAHRCFLSERCLYIIVYDGRTEDRNRLDYWLEHVKIYGGNSRVMVLINRRDKHAPEVPKNKLRRDYPFILDDFAEFSLRDDDVALRQFRLRVAEFILDNPSWNRQKLPTLYFEIKDDLLERFAQNHDGQKTELITREVFDEIALKNGCAAADIEKVLSSLHALGICLWYRELNSFHTLVLNPEWISHGIYRLINWAKDNGKYRISKKDCMVAFAEEIIRYPKEKHSFLLRLMCEYQLAYVDEDNDGIVVPVLLSNDLPDDLPTFEIRDSLMLEYVAENSLPADTICRFIVLQHHDIAEGVRNVWRYGVVLDNGAAIALVEENDRRIRVSAKGRGKREYISSLRATLNHIFDTYKNIQPELNYRIVLHEPQTIGIPQEFRNNSWEGTSLTLPHDLIRSYLQKGENEYYDYRIKQNVPLSLMAYSYDISNHIYGGRPSIDLGIGNRVPPGNTAKPNHEPIVRGWIMAIIALLTVAVPVYLATRQAPSRELTEQQLTTRIYDGILYDENMQYTFIIPQSVGLCRYASKKNLETPDVTAVAGARIKTNYAQFYADEQGMQPWPTSMPSAVEAIAIQNSSSDDLPTIEPIQRHTTEAPTFTPTPASVVSPAP